MNNQVDRARDALQSIPSDLPRDIWVKAGMAAHAAGLEFADFDSWSASGGNYNAQASRATWHSFKAIPDGVGVGTLFGMAREYGWTDANKSLKPVPRQSPLASEAPRKSVTAISAVEVWNRCEPATPAHAYIQAKCATSVPLDGLRVVPVGDPLHIIGESMAGALVVPCNAADGSLSALQFITVGDTADRLKAANKATKVNLPGGKVDGLHTVGTPKPGEPIYITEGIGTAWAIWMATGSAAVVTFGSGNTRKVAKALRQREDAHQLVLCPDVGKESEAERIATEFGAAVARMPEGWPNNSDLNDLFQSPDGGFDAVAELLEAATAQHKPEPLLKPISVFDVVSNPSPPTRFAWDGYLPQGVVSMLGAHGGTGKSTIALMLGVCAALGRSLFDVPTRPCRVLFVSLEDSAPIVRHRLAHICRTWGIDPGALVNQLQVVDGTDHPELFAAETRGNGETTATFSELRRLSEGVGLVLVDNASDAYGGDEIQRKQVRAFIRALGSIAKNGDCAVLLLAHVDKGTARARKAEGGEGYSGSTAWHNSVRSRLFLSRGEDSLLTLEHQKSNLGKLRDPLMLEWNEGGLPQLVHSGGFEFDGINLRQEGKADDERAAALLRLIAEFEARQQYCSPAAQARNNVHSVLKCEPAFLKLKLKPDDTKRIVNQSQRAKWIESVDYRSVDRKPRQRWTVTSEGRLFAGLPGAPTVPTALTSKDGAQSAESSSGGAPTAPTYAGGVGDRARTNEVVEVISHE